MKILFWCQGAGEFAIAQELLDYCIEKGDQCLLCLDTNTVRVLSREQMVKYGVIEYDLQSWDIPGRLKITIDRYKPDVFVMQPSRTWQMSIERPKVKLCIGLECNMLFGGVSTYKLDIVRPEWLDFYVVTFDETFVKKGIEILYGVDELPKAIKDKVRYYGWFQKKLAGTVQKGDYTFIYFGSGVTGNQWWLQKVLDALPDKNANILAVSQDNVIGNYPNLQIVPGLKTKDFELALAGAKYCIFHEGYGSIGKALMNKVPFISVRNGTKYKYVETEPLNQLGWAKAIDFTDIKGPEDVTTNITSEQMPDLEWGVPGAYELIKNAL